MIPTVTVVMPTYNRAHLISTAIESVLSQDFKDFELIVVDDGSVDNTKEVVTSFQDPRVIYIKQENKGVAAARNTGLRRAKGRYITYCDDDDTLLPDTLSTMASYLDHHPEIGLVYGDVIRKPIKGLSASGYPNKAVGFRSIDFDKERLELDCILRVPGTMHRKECLKTAGLWDEDEILAKYGCSDYDFWLRVADDWRFAHIPQIVARAYVHTSNFLHRRNDILTRIYIARKRLKKFKQISNGNHVAPYLGYYSRLFQILFWISEDHSKKGEAFCKKIVEAAGEFASLDRENFEIWLTLCFCLHTQGDKEKAIEAGEKGLVLLPSHFEFSRFGYLDDVPPLWMRNTCTFLAQALAEKGEMGLALRCAEKAVEFSKAIQAEPERTKTKLWFNYFREKWKS